MSHLLFLVLHSQSSTSCSIISIWYVSNRSDTATNSKFMQVISPSRRCSLFFADVEKKRTTIRKHSKARGRQYYGSSSRRYRYDDTRGWEHQRRRRYYDIDDWRQGRSIDPSPPSLALTTRLLVVSQWPMTTWRLTSLLSTFKKCFFPKLVCIASFV